MLYDYFEKELGLRKKIIRKDYRFSDMEEAIDLGTFFFGDEVGAEIQRIGELVVYSRSHRKYDTAKYSRRMRCLMGGAHE